MFKSNQGCSTTKMTVQDGRPEPHEIGLLKEGVFVVSDNNADTGKGSIYGYPICCMRSCKYKMKKDRRS